MRRQGQQRFGRRVLAGGLVFGLVGFAWPGDVGIVSAAPPPPGASTQGPPPSEVLAKDPSQVQAPSNTLAAEAAACPPAPYGVHSYAPGAGKTVALTFDDGPGATTEAIMAILEDEGVAGTFFNIGVNSTVRPQFVQAEAAQGYLLGNHTWDHQQLTKLTASQQASEMDRATAEQASLVGTNPCYFRPPYGSYNTTTLSLAQARGMSVWNWSVDTEDWKSRGSASSYWINRIIQLGTSGGNLNHPVVLMHNPPNALPATVAALPTIIRYYRDRGYVFVDLAGQQARKPVAGDWDGNGSTTPGVVVGNTWYLRNSNSSGSANATFSFGLPTDKPVVGDWDGNGTVTPGVVRGNTWYLRNSNSGGAANVTFSFGLPTDKPVVGDWDGNGTTTAGIVRGNVWYLRNSNSGGAANVSFGFGQPSDRPVVGDWDGNGTSTPGLVRSGTWYLRNSNSAGGANVTFSYGLSTDRPLAGDWDGNGTSTPGIVRGKTWYLRNANSGGGANLTFAFGP